MVKDTRTAHETPLVQAVLDGGLAPFMDSYLRWSAAKRAEDEDDRK